ncbi:hypothetical protein F2Q69_00001738 [Brassica cretica]|uniref:Transmembrane protein n=1 Tax=Brassica cretica TaxID=69181 RepID=A0A8S9NMJ6_BRACR|nr:hypothetical protein F2Q69_00001738 [Brassica cretica]
MVARPCAYRRQRLRPRVSVLLCCSCFDGPASPSICTSLWVRVWLRRLLCCRGFASPAVSLLPLVPWREGGAMVGCCSRLFGFESRSFSPKIWSVSFAREEEVWFDYPRSSMGLAFRTRVSFGSGWSFLVLVVLVGRWFSFSSQSVCRWVSLPRQCALCIEFAGELVLEYNQGSCRSSSWFKGRLSMPPQWPPALSLHFESSLPDSLACPFSGGVSLELARWFSTASSVQVVLVSLTAYFERLVFAHIPASLRSDADAQRRQKIKATDGLKRSPPRLRSREEKHEPLLPIRSDESEIQSRTNKKEATP